MSDLVSIDLNAPCLFCGYNGPLYWQAGSHDSDCPFLKVGGGLERNEILPTIVSQQFEELRLMRQILDDIGYDEKSGKFLGN